MVLELRPYQRQAVDRVIEHFKTSCESACVVLPTGSGKSLVIAELCRRAQGRVLVLAHVKELCRQNHDKYTAITATDRPTPLKRAGIFSAGLGKRECDRPVTFGSIQSVARHVESFSAPITLLVVDECHRVSGQDGSQYRHVIEELRKKSPTLKVLGLTATPYRLGLGWSYRQHHRGFFRTDEERPFEHCVYELSLSQLIQDGYLTRPTIEDAPIAQYDYEALARTADCGSDTLNQLLQSKGRVTKSIVSQVVDIAVQQKRRGVMLFAATVEHAREIAGYLPAHETALIIGATDDEERDSLVRAFGNQSIRYLVNVSVLTTGFDAPHVDLIALLRPTESVSLYQQIVGRGLRLFPGKKDCLVIDYTGSGFSLYSPEVGEKRPSSDSVVVPVPCPSCGFENQFWGRSDADGRVVEHFGRRCQGRVEGDRGMQRCDFRFRFKECPHCFEENDIAARRCESCASILVDPDDQLRNALGLKDARVLRIAGMTFRDAGLVLHVTYHDEDGETESERFDFSKPGQRAIFNRVYGRRIAQGRKPLALETPQQAITLQAHIPSPDFVIFRRASKKRTAPYRVAARIFDYQGRYRVADR